MLAIAIVFFVAGASLLIPNHSPYSRFWRPSFLFALFSGLGLTYTNFRFGFESIDGTIVYLYAMGVFSFFLGDLLFSLIPYSRTESGSSKVDFSVGAFLRTQKIITPFVILSIVSGLLLVFLFRERTAFLGGNTLGYNLRYAASVANLPSYGAFHFLLFAQVLSSILVLSESVRHRAYGMLLYAIQLGASFVAVSRTMGLFSLISLAFLMYARTRSLRPMALPIFISIFIMFFYAVVAGKESMNNSSFVDYYVGYPLIAFNDYVYWNSERDYGINSLGTLGSIITGRGEPEDLRLTESEFNVYSFIGSPFRDFGVLGVFMFPLIFGAIWSMVFGRTGERPIYLLMYSWMIFPLILPFFDWKFNQTSFIYLAILYAVTVKARFVRLTP